MNKLTPTEGLPLSRKRYVIKAHESNKAIIAISKAGLQRAYPMYSIYQVHRAVMALLQTAQDIGLSDTANIAGEIELGYHTFYIEVRRNDSKWYAQIEKNDEDEELSVEEMKAERDSIRREIQFLIDSGKVAHHVTDTEQHFPNSSDSKEA